MTCAICGIRKPKRYCPGVRGEICTICCGTEREQTITCPVECGYLREAHDHEKKPAFDASILPNKDIEVSDAFLHDNQLLIAVLGKAVAMGALRPAEATDYDIREGLEALIGSYRALQSGLYMTRIRRIRTRAGFRTPFRLVWPICAKRRRRREAIRSCAIPRF